jgi:hypothetical protein
MIIGDLKYQINKVWESFWTGGIKKVINYKLKEKQY